MFYKDETVSYRLLGVYRVTRKPGPPRTHSGRDFATLAYRIRGNSRFTQGDRAFFAGTGSTVFLPDGAPFRRVTSGQEEILVIHLACAGERDRTIGVENETEFLAPLFEKMLAVWEEGGPLARNRCMILLYSIFEALQKREGPDEARVPDSIAPGVALLRKRFRDPSFRVSEAARASFVSEVYFRRIFRKAFGRSPLQSLLEMRFDHARELLSSGYYSVKEAARFSGFSDVKYFRTAYTRRFGQSPSARAKGEKNTG